MYSIWIERYSPAGILQQDIPGYIFLGSLQIKKSKFKIVTSSNIKELNFSLFLSVKKKLQKITHWEQQRSNGNFRFSGDILKFKRIMRWLLWHFPFTVWYFYIFKYQSICNAKSIVENLMATRKISQEIQMF